MGNFTNKNNRYRDRNESRGSNITKKNTDFDIEETLEIDDDIKNELIIGRNPVIEALKSEKLIDIV